MADNKVISLTSFIKENDFDTKWVVSFAKKFTARNTLKFKMGKIERSGVET